MKSIVKISVSALLCALALGSCSKEKEEDLTPSSKKQKITFTACQSDTKTIFGDKTDGKYPTLWTANQQVAISYNLGAFQNVDVQNISEDKKTASFTAEIEPDTAEGATHTFYAVSPAYATKYDNGKLHVSVEMVQEPLSDSCDEKSQVLIAKSKTSDALPSNVELSFHHALAYGKLNMVLPDGQSVKSIEMVSSEKIAGWFVYNEETDSIEVLDNGLYVSHQYLYVSTTLSEGIYFSLFPIGDMKGKTLKITIDTKEGKSYTKTIAPLESGKLAFNAGQVSEFTVNFTK